MTERFTQAIEQLGSEKLEIKLGGIYSLERTAQEEKNYHWPVMEVLTSYVRRHAARKPDQESKENAATPEPDIQAILDVIGRRSEDHRTDEKMEYGTIDLSNTNLRFAILQRAILKGASLIEAELLGADLTDANLQEANLRSARLQGAIGITEDQIEWTVGSNATKLGEDLNRPEVWSKSIDEQEWIIKEHFGFG